MNVHQMKIFARSLVRDDQLLDAHFLRWLNVAYRELASLIIVPKLNNGDPVELIPVDDSTQKFYCPYDYGRTISFTDDNDRSLDILLSEDVRQYGEYNSFGSFVQFYEHCSANITPLYNSVDASVTLAITNRSTTATASSAIFTDEHIGEWLLPIDRNSTAGAANPEDYGYLISNTSGTVAVPTTTCTLERPFRGTLSEAGTVGSLSTSYFEIRPRNTPMIRIWGDPGSAETISMEYQRIPTKLANDEDIPEEPRLSHAMVYKAIQLAGWSYKQTFSVKSAENAIATALASFTSSKDFDKQLIRNYLTANPMNRGYSQISGMHMGRSNFRTSGIRY